MANTKKIFKQGIRLEPIGQPETTSEGDAYFSDGSIRPKGFYKYQDGDWQVLGGGSADTSIEINQASHGFTLFQGVYINGSGTLVAADNTSDSTLPTHTIVEVIDTNNVKIQADSIAEVDASSLTIGETYWIQNDGSNSTVEPTTLGEYAQPMFFVVSATHIQLLNTSAAVLITELNGVLPQAPYYHGTRTSGAINLPNDIETIITFSEDVNNPSGISNGLGTYTLPEDGLYACEFHLLLNTSTAWDETEYVQIYITLRDSAGNLKDRRVVDRRFQDDGFAWARGSTTFTALTGDRVEFSAIQTSDVTLATHTVSDIYTRGTISKIGNNTSTSLPSVVDKPNVKKQTKYLSADVTTDDANIFDLRFNNLVPGNVYRITYNINLIHSIDGTVAVRILHDGNLVAQPKLSATQTGSEQITNHETFTSYVLGPFVATATTVEIFGEFIQTGDIIKGNGLVTESHATIEELPFTITETTEF